MTDSPDWTTFGKRLEHAMQFRKPVERKELAAVLRSPKTGEMGISVAAIGQTLSGVSIAMNAENAARAARFLGVDFYWLCTGEGEPGEHTLSAAELKTMDGLRTIEQFNAETHAELLDQIETIAAGLISTHQVLSGHGVTGYVSPSRAAEKLKPAATNEPKPPIPPKTPAQKRIRR